MRLLNLKFALLSLSLATAPAAFAGTVTFATIATGANTANATGTIGSVGFTFTGQNANVLTADPFSPSFTNQPTGTYAYAADNAFFQFTGNGVETFVFSTPVTGLFLDEYSEGGGSTTTSYAFSSAYTILSCGPNQPYGGGCFSPGGVGSTGTVLSGDEANGTLQFASPISTLTVTITNGENYNGFDLGIASSPVVSSTPEPGSLVLFGTGLVGLAGAVRRRFNR